MPLGPPSVRWSCTGRLTCPFSPPTRSYSESEGEEEAEEENNNSNGLSLKPHSNISSRYHLDIEKPMEVTVRFWGQRAGGEAARAAADAAGGGSCAHAMSVRIAGAPAGCQAVGQRERELQRRRRRRRDHAVVIRTHDAAMLNVSFFCTPRPAGVSATLQPVAGLRKGYA